MNVYTVTRKFHTSIAGDRTADYSVLATSIQHAAEIAVRFGKRQGYSGRIVKIEFLCAVDVVYKSEVKSTLSA